MFWDGQYKTVLCTCTVLWRLTVHTAYSEISSLFEVRNWNTFSATANLHVTDWFNLLIRLCYQVKWQIIQSRYFVNILYIVQNISIVFCHGSSTESKNISWNLHCNLATHISSNSSVSIVTRIRLRRSSNSGSTRNKAKCSCPFVTSASQL
jgi:hypothetical protein